jgi:hypothetical protein
MLIDSSKFYFGFSRWRNKGAGGLIKARKREMSRVKDLTQKFPEGVFFIEFAIGKNTLLKKHRTNLVNEF